MPESKKEEIIRMVNELFGDTTRPKQETKDDLLDIAQECEMMAETIDTE